MTMMVKRLMSFISICAAAAVFLTSCAVYTFNPAGKSEIKTIAVERFENSTAEYGLADRMLDIVIDAFIADGNMKVVPADKADAVLYGALKAYRREPYTYDQNDQVQEYQVVMDFNITLKNPRDDSEIWKETMNQTGIYDVLNETEEDGQNRAIGFLVESIINRTTKSW